MIDHHSVFVQELSQVQRFLNRVYPAGVPTADTPAEPVLDHVALAFEDIPEDMHAVVRMALLRPGEDRGLRQAVIDVVKNLAGMQWGDAEVLMNKLPLLHILSSLRYHLPYTYRVDQKVVRGSRPTPQKLALLAKSGCTTTINLCREMDTGDEPTLTQAGLTGQMNPIHIPITDDTPPQPEDVQSLFDAITESAGSAYVHCEAGVGRTGVMVACYRMQQGWSMRDALHEARNFGCSMPDQLAFIEDFTVPGTAMAETPSAQQLQQTAVLNADPAGLSRITT